MNIVWEPAARADLRRLDRDTAMRILVALTRYAEVGEGDVKRLTGRDGLYRLRIGKWRMFLIWMRQAAREFTLSIIGARRTGERRQL